MKMHELPTSLVYQQLVCPGCGNHFPIPSGPDVDRDAVRTGAMVVLHCTHCHEVCQGRFFVPQPDIHEIARLRGEVRRTP